MSDGSAHASGRANTATTGTQDPQTSVAEWTRIERSAEFRELTARRHRFIAMASAVTFGVFLIYLGLATFAVDLMGTTVGGVPIAWLAAMTQVLLTWAVTWTYLRKAEREFEPLERRVRETAGARFTREESTTAAEPVATERSAR
jgi:uncharacterized membrane protein (DUF485 family)